MPHSGFLPEKKYGYGVDPPKCYLGVHVYDHPKAFFSKCSNMLLNIFKYHHKSWKVSFSTKVYFNIWVRIFTSGRNPESVSSVSE
jgi:hypothetical protein